MREDIDSFLYESILSGRTERLGTRGRATNHPPSRGSGVGGLSGGTCAQKRWLRLRGFRHLASVVADVKFIDGIDERETGREAA